MLKMSKIDQIHLRAVMLCMSKMSKMGKEHTHTFWLITSLILMDFQSAKSFGKLRLRAFQPYHQILCILKHVEDVEDRSNTHKGCNAMYVEDVEDGKRTYTHILAHNFLNINGFSIRKKFWKAETQSFPTIPSNTVYIKACWRR